jgi:hypothetical protein
MKKELSNKLNSYTAVRGVLEENLHIYGHIALMNQSVEEFYRKVDEINAVAVGTKEDGTGQTAAKELAKEKLAALASALAASASIYAYDTSDVELESELRLSYTDIKYARDSEAYARARALEDELLEHRHQLEAYLITSRDLEELHRYITVYNDALERRGGVKSQRTAGFIRLEELFGEADRILYRKIDRFVLRLKSEFPAFYDAYTHARSIVDL